MYKCKLNKLGSNVKDKRVIMKNMFGNNDKYIEESFGKCFNEEDIDESDWRPFYEMFKCLSEKVDQLKKAYEPIEKIQNKCNDKYIVREIDIHNAQITKEKRESYGCYVKCVHEGLGSFRDGAIKPESFSKLFHDFPAIEEMLINAIHNCIKEVDKKYEGKTRNTCDYFFDFNFCTDKEEFMRNL